MFGLSKAEDLNQAQKRPIPVPSVTGDTDPAGCG